MHGKAPYDETKLPATVHMSPTPTPQSMDVASYPRVYPLDGSLPDHFCLKECSHNLQFCFCTGGCKACMIYGCLGGITRCMWSRAGMYQGGKEFDRKVLDKMFPQVKMGVNFNKKNGVTTRTFTIPSREEGRDMHARMASTEAKEGELKPLVVFFYGGGFVTGSASDGNVDEVLQNLASRLKCVALCFNYRRAPENPFPCGLEDAYDGLVWLQKQKEAGSSNILVENNADLSNCSIMGESAGGNLAFVLATLLRDGLDTDLKEASAGMKSFKLKALGLIYPVLMLPYATPSQFAEQRNPLVPYFVMRFYKTSYIGESDDLTMDRRVSPMLAGVDNLPPTVLSYCQWDPLCDENALLAKKLEASNTQSSSRYFKKQAHAAFAFASDQGSVQTSMRAFMLTEMERVLQNK